MSQNDWGTAGYNCGITIPRIAGVQLGYQWGRSGVSMESGRSKIGHSLRTAPASGAGEMDGKRDAIVPTCRGASKQ